MKRKDLHVLSQRPSFTGSGITLDALTRHGAAAGWDQHVVVGTPADDGHPDVGGLAPERIHALRFAAGTRATGADVPFAVPGMSDGMPYESTRFSNMTAEQLTEYEAAWTRHLEQLLAQARPDVIHAHHAWILGALLKTVAPDIPVVLHGHGTGLRQMELSPRLRGRVREGCRRADRLVVLHKLHAAEYGKALGIESDRIHVVGAGFREDLFHRKGRSATPGATLLYAG